MGKKRSSKINLDTIQLADRSARVNEYASPVEILEVSAADVSRLLHMPRLEASSLCPKTSLRLERKPFGGSVLSLVTFHAGNLAMMPLEGQQALHAEFRLTVCLSSAKMIRGGRETSLRRGEMLLIDLAEGVSLSTTGSTTWLSLSIPRGAIAARMGGAAQPFSSVPTLQAMVIPREGSMAWLFRSSLFQLWKGDAGLPPVEGAEAAEVLLDLLVEAVRETVVDQKDLQSQRLLALIQVTETIDSAISDPTLNAASLAKRMGLTKGYLNETLGGISAAVLIRQHRLHRARRLLRTGASKGLTIAEIGRLVGFGSLTHFSTIYSETFGTSPAHDHIDYCN